MPGTNGYQDIFFEGVSAVTATKTAGLNLGTVRFEGGRKYQYVYNAGTTQISTGDGAIITATTGFSVTVSSVTSVTPCFGVCREATITTGTYGWLVKEGYCNVNAAAADSMAVGDNLVLGTDGVHQAVTGATGYMTNRHGYCVQGTATAGTGYAYISCL